MKRNATRIGLLLLIVSILLGSSSCSIPEKIPQGGVFYCDEMGISIDFSIIDTDPECGKLYAADGSYTTCRCMTDYGIGIVVMSTDQEIDYLIGKFQYKNDLFYVTAYKDGTTYVFERGDSWENGDGSVVPSESE